MIKLEPVNSSLIAAYGYDSTNYVLLVRFKSEKANRLHQYSPVYPPTVSEVFDTPGSIGSKFIKQIQRGPFIHTIANDSPNSIKI